MTGRAAVVMIPPVPPAAADPALSAAAGVAAAGLALFALRRHRRAESKADHDAQAYAHGEVIKRHAEAGADRDAHGETYADPVSARQFVAPLLAPIAPKRNHP